MAPISPDSLKRFSPSQSDDDHVEPPAKRRRIDLIEPTLPQTPPNEPEEYVVPPQQDHEKSFNDDPKHLLLRSIALALQHVGFDSAKPEAMEAMCAQVESYASKFLSQITGSMQNARRTQPIPLDFEYALWKFDLPFASLAPHLNPPIPSNLTQIRLEAVSTSELEDLKEKEKLSTLILGDELNGELDKDAKLYIPKNFIPFPSKHTYKWTDIEVKPKRDRRMVREANAKEARKGEEALSRYMASIESGKSAKGKEISTDPQIRKSHTLWENVMTSLMSNQKSNGIVKDKQDERKSKAVNAESQYFRHLPERRKIAEVDIRRG